MSEKMRFAVDTGGTFTDLVVEDGDGRLSIHKSPTVPSDPVRGVLNVLRVAAEDFELSFEELLSRGSLFIHGTTRGLNAILTGTAARTAFLTTKGHPDILLFREGGRTDAFNFTRAYPEPYVPRRLTFEVPERLGSGGEVVQPLDEGEVLAICDRLEEEQVEAVGVCLLWSIVNSDHERRVGELIRDRLPGLAVTLSHELSPTIREYRRASATCIDASLKPVMSEYIGRLEEELRSAGFEGRLLGVTSGGGMLDIASLAAAPIHALNSGPCMAPVAGRYYSHAEVDADTAVIADTGGTSYDVSVVRRGRIPVTKETWLGEPYFGHMTGFPSVDVKSIGAGGGSIARVDIGGLLHVGPESAGAEPGPVCYARGGERVTVTDASVILGYINPDYFLGGKMQLDKAAASAAMEEQVATPLGLSVEDAAAAVVQVATENMVRAIEEITLHQGIDPQSAVLVGGGGAAGLNTVAVARRLGCPKVIVPGMSAALSAVGALMSDLAAEYTTTLVTHSARFDYDSVNQALESLESACREFAEGPGAAAISTETDFFAEVRYPHQTWELEAPLRVSRFTSDADVQVLREDFHAVHEEVFAIADRDSEIEPVTWRARVRCRLRESDAVVSAPPKSTWAPEPRPVYFAGAGTVMASVYSFDSLTPGQSISGPAIIESPTSSLVVDVGATAEHTASGNLVISPAPTMEEIAHA